LGLGLKWYDWFGIAVDASVHNVEDVVTLAGKGAVGAVDFATGGRLSGAKKAYDTFQSTPGSTSEKLEAAGKALSRQQTNVMTLGFSDAADKVQHAKNLVGIGGIHRGTATMFEGIVEGDADKALRGFAEAAGGTGQLAGTAATLYAPFAPKLAPATAPPEQLLMQGGRYEALAEAPISGLSRSAHRAAANRALMRMLEEDPNLAEYLTKELGRDVVEHMKSGKSGLRNPPGTEWHHPLENPDVMYLLRREVHRHPGLQEVLNEAEGGGYAKYYGPGIGP